MLASIALFAAILFSSAALAQGEFHDVPVPLDRYRSTVQIGIYYDEHTTWNNWILYSPIELETKLLGASHEKPSPFFVVMTHGSGKRMVSAVLALLRRYRFRYVLISGRPSD